jgi:hypothetical protein
MDSRSAAARPAHPDAVEFVRFCYRRKHVGWPELYDEMCAVANRGTFRGLDVDALAGIGIGLCLSDMPGLAAIVAQVVAEEQQARRPVAVRIVTDAEHDDEAGDQQEEQVAGMRPRLVPISVSA